MLLNLVSKLIVWQYAVSTCGSSSTKYWVHVWVWPKAWDLLIWGPLLGLLTSNLNLSLSTFSTKELIKGFGALGICPLLHALEPSGSSSLSLSRLNKTIVSSLFVSEPVLGFSLKTPLVIKGLFSSTHVHRRKESVGSAHGGRKVKVDVLLGLGKWLEVLKGSWSGTGLGGRSVPWVWSGEELRELKGGGRDWGIA